MDCGDFHRPAFPVPFHWPDGFRQYGFAGVTDRFAHFYGMAVRFFLFAGRFFPLERHVFLRDSPLEKDQEDLVDGTVENRVDDVAPFRDFRAKYGVFPFRETMSIIQVMWIG